MIADMLRGTDALFDVIANNTSDLIIVAGLDGAASYVSPACRQLTGYDPEELMGALSLELVHPKDRSRLTALLQGLTDSESYTPAYRILGKDGNYVWIESTVNLLRDPVTAEAIEVIAISRDITVRQRAEERYEVLEAAPNAMIMAGADGLITFVNARTGQLFGYERHELLGRSIEMLVPERFRANHGGHRNAFCGAPATRAMGAGRDLFGLRKDGSEVPVEIGLNTIDTVDGRFVLASLIDITERGKAEELLRRSLDEKTTLLQEVHHRVKNNLQVICSLLSIQIGCSDGDLFSRPLQDAHSRVLAMSLIHAQIYQSETLADLNFSAYISFSRAGCLARTASIHPVYGSN